jgi:competence protein ComEC
LTGIGLGAALLLGFLLRDSHTGWAAVPLVLAGIAAGLMLLPDRRGRIAVIVAAGLLTFGAWWAGFGVTMSNLPSELAQAKRFTGVVLDSPRRYPSGSYARLAVREPGPAILTARFPTFPEVKQGDVVRAYGSASPRDRDPGLDEPRYLTSNGAVGDLWATWLTVESSEATTAQRVRNTITDSFAGRIRRAIPEPAGTLATGLLLGNDDAMTRATRDAFRSAGLSHITAVSGWNIAVVAGLFGAIGTGGLIDRRLQLIAAIAGVWAFTYLVGAPPSALRAAVMGTVYLLAHLRGRPKDTLTALVWATALLIVMTPPIRFDPGFQLSVAATLALTAAVPYLESRRWLVLAGIPLAAEIAVSPLLWHHFGTYSLISPLANVVAAPLVAPAMAGAALVVAASFIHPFLAAMVGLVAWVPGRMIIAITEVAAGIPWASGKTMALGTNGVIIAYAALLALYLWMELRYRPVTL